MENLVRAVDVAPKGKRGECFWCHEKFGNPQKDECVTITKRVEVASTITGVIDVPISWDADRIEFHMNETGNCINNQLEQIEGDSMCFCGRAEGKYIQDVSIN